jgi:hypothetical protein
LEIPVAFALPFHLADVIRALDGLARNEFQRAGKEGNFA